MCRVLFGLKTEDDVSKGNGKNIKGHTIPTLDGEVKRHNDDDENTLVGSNEWCGKDEENKRRAKIL